MTAPAVAFAAAAADALTRSDNGLPAQPGDRALIDAYEQQCQLDAGRFQLAVWAAEDAVGEAVWLAAQCRYCGPKGSTGPDCGECDGPEMQS